jgi:hypothetical protein
MSEKSGSKQFGWQGFVLEIPQGCRFMAESGNIKSGYMRFDAGKLQFEIKWDPLSEKSKIESSDIAETLVQKIGKKLKKEPLKHKKASTQVYGHEATSVHFRTDKENQVVVWPCQESNRIAVAQFVFQDASPQQRKVAQSILESVKCHGFEEHLWSVLGFSITTPKSFQLKERRLMVGRSTLNIVEEKATLYRHQKTELIFECFSLANIQFKETYVDPRQWIEKYYANELKQRFKRMKLQRCSSHHFHNHSMARCTVKACSHMMGQRNVLLSVAAWYCENSARIYSLTLTASVKKIPFTKGVSSEELMKLHKRILSTVVCH